MARSLKEIYDSIVTATEANNHLSSLDVQAGETMDDFVSNVSPSRVSIWRLWAFISAYFIWLHEKQNETFQIEMEQLAARKQVGTLKWYQQQVLNFLMGKPILWNSTLNKYEQELLPSDDPVLLRIVKYCAVVKAPQVLRIKVATDNNGVPGQLSASEQTAVEAYVNTIRMAWDTIEIVNNPADKIKLVLDAYVDPLIINTSTGELHASPGVKPVEDAINDYLLNLNFNGRFVRNYLIDSIQAAEGLSNVDVNTLQSKYAAFPYTNIDVSVIPDAGYFEIETLTINYYPSEE